jgi:hypothetical protein
MPPRFTLPIGLFLFLIEIYWNIGYVENNVLG